MATINLGNIKFNWKGAYAGGTAYVIDDVVSYSGSSYICKLASTGNLPTNATYWEQMSAAGTDGTDGTDLTSTLTTVGDIVYHDGSGLARLARGAASEQLAMNAGATAPEWVAAAGGGVTEIDQWRLTTDFTGTAQPIDSNWERVDVAARLQGYLGTGMSESSGIFTFPSTGFWLVIYRTTHALDGDERHIRSNIYTTNDDSSYDKTTESVTHIKQTNSTWTGACSSSEAVLDVTDVANDKVRFEMYTLNASTLTQGNTDYNITSVTFVRLGDT